jgi:hypothetical protein
MILNLLLDYPDQNISNEFKPKKMLSYIKTDKTDVTPMRSDGQITADTKQNVGPASCRTNGLSDYRYALLQNVYKNSKEIRRLVITNNNAPVV